MEETPQPSHPQETPREESPNLIGEPVSPAQPSPEEPAILPLNEAPSQESGFRRFMKAALRWLILLVVMFGVGAGVTYYFLVLPLNARVADLETRLAQSQQLAEQNSQDLNSTRSQLAGLQKQYDQSQAELKTATNRTYLQTVLTDLANARLALANKDGANARASLVGARTHLEPLSPAVKEKDSERSEVINSRLNIVLNELNRDPTQAIKDLDTLIKEVEALQKVLFE